MAEETVIVIQEENGTMSKCSYVLPASVSEQLFSGDNSVTEIIFETCKDTALNIEQMPDHLEAPKPSTTQHLVSLLPKDISVTSALMHQRAITTRPDARSDLHLESGGAQFDKVSSDFGHAEFSSFCKVEVETLPDNTTSSSEDEGALLMQQKSSESRTVPASTSGDFQQESFLHNNATQATFTGDMDTLKNSLLKVKAEPSLPSNNLKTFDLQTAISNLKLNFSFRKPSENLVATDNVEIKSESDCCSDVSSSGETDQINKAVLDHAKSQAFVVPNLRSREGGPFVCKVCNKSFNVSMSLDMHELSHYHAHELNSVKKTLENQERLKKRKDLKPFLCKECLEFVPNRRRLTKHMLDKHNLDFFYTCRCCRFMCLDCVEYVAHTSSEEHKIQSQLSRKETASHPKKFLCSVCGAGFQHNISLQNHQSTHVDPSKRQVQCPHCPFVAKSRHSLGYHLTTHTNRLFKCSQCPYTTPFQYFLRKHVKTHLQAAAKHVVHHCRQCEAKFEKMYELRLHAINIHNSSDTFFCTKCDFTCQNKKIYFEHLHVHKKSKFKYRCDQCDFMGSTPGALKLHIATHSDERPYACDKCPVRYKGKTQLKRHQSKHSTDKSFLCSECPTTTRTRGELFRHMLKHSTTKKHSCHVCDYKTHHVGNLTKHVALHNSAKPFLCPHCPYSGRLRQHLRSHLRRFHKLEMERTRVTECHGGNTEPPLEQVQTSPDVPPQALLVTVSTAFEQS